MLTETASGDSGTASDSSNIASAVGSYVEGAIVSVAGSGVSEYVTSLSSTVWGAIGGTTEK